MRINHNIAALQASMNIRKNGRALATSMQRLSSGLKINSAKDDSAGLAISNKLDVQVKGLTRASQNAMDGISLIQVAEGALSEVHNMLQRMRELAVQAANGTNITEDRSKIQMEIDSLCEEISAISSRTEFNKIKVLNGEANRIATSNERTVAMPMYVSESVPAGQLTYDIIEPGEPATFSFKLTSPTQDMKLNVNGVSVELLAMDSEDEAKQKLLNAFEAAGIDVEENTTDGKMYLATRVAGSSQIIDIKCEPSNIANPLGLGSSTVYEVGKNAKIDNVMLTNVDGTPNAAFNSTHSVVADGNVVTITSNKGQEIKLNIKVHMNDEGEVVYDKQVGVGANNKPIFMPITTSPMNMTLDISDYGPIKLHIGPNFSMQMDIVIPTLSSETLGLVEYKGGVLSRMLNYQSEHGPTEAIGKLDWAISKVSETRARLGAYQNRLEMTVRSLDATAESTETARSRLQDTNVAEETTRYTQYQVIEQAGISILGQANQRPQQILSLLN